MFIAILTKRIILWEEKEEPFNHPTQINKLIEKYKNSETYAVRRCNLDRKNVRYVSYIHFFGVHGLHTQMYVIQRN